jgi:hypothetical protein
MPISRKKLQANRLNATHSTGPPEKWGQTSLSQNPQTPAQPRQPLVDRAVCPHF